MRYFKAAAAVFAIVVAGGTVLRFVDDGPASHAVTVAMFLAAGLAARWLLREP